VGPRSKLRPTEAVANRTQTSRLGKVRTTRVRRLISWLSRSSPLVVRRRVRWWECITREALLDVLVDLVGDVTVGRLPFVSQLAYRPPRLLIGLCREDCTDALSQCGPFGVTCHSQKARAWSLYALSSSNSSISCDLVQRFLNTVAHVGSSASYSSSTQSVPARRERSSSAVAKR